MICNSSPYAIRPELHNCAHLQSADEGPACAACARCGRATRTEAVAAPVQQPALSELRLQAHLHAP